MAGDRSWPTANAYSQALQNPATAFADPLLRTAEPARDRLGMPLVMSGNFAYVFKLLLADGGARAVKCFRRPLGDRGDRFEAIDQELERLGIEDIAHFEHDAEGVLVEGGRYPTLVMEWVDGPTLDVYVGEILRTGQSEALADLARQWAELVAKLEEAGIAHGDLQHGNVIATASGLRLVDLDGMYVPALRGRGSPGEVGHRHYQHPARTVADFDPTLDRFASLVIHLSLTALAAEPELWQEFHDDNLIFERSDFEKPFASRVFSRLAVRGGEVGRLADALRRAAEGPLSAVPPLTSLVTVERSRLPLWMRVPIVPTIARKTRESKAQDIVAATAPPPPRPVPASPAFGSLAPPAPLPAMPRAAAHVTYGRPGAGRRNALYGSALLPTPRVPPGAQPETSLGKAALVLGAVLFVVGLPCSGVWAPVVRPLVGGSDVAAFAVWAVASAVLAVAILRVLGVPWPTFLREKPAPVFALGSAASQSLYVGSSLLGTYHLPGCPDARRLANRNRVWFSSDSDARRRGLQACPLCRPGAQTP